MEGMDTKKEHMEKMKIANVFDNNSAEPSEKKWKKSDMIADPRAKCEALNSGLQAP